MGYASAVPLHLLSFDFAEACRQRLVPGEGSDSQSSEICKLRGAFSPLSFSGFSICTNPGKVNNPPPSLLLISFLLFFAPSLFDDLTAQVLLLMLAGINVNEVWMWLCSPQHLCGKVRFKVEADEAVWFWTP